MLLALERTRSGDASPIQAEGGDVSRVTRRTLRLFACACCRSVWNGVPCTAVGPHHRDACDHGRVQCPNAQFTEDCAACRGTGRVGGLTDPRSLAAVEVAERFADGGATYGDLNRAWRESGPGWTICSVASNPAGHADWAAKNIVGGSIDGPCPSADVQADLLRCLVGNPFRPVTLPRSRVPCPTCHGEKTVAVPCDDGSARVETCLQCEGSGRQDGPCPWLTPTVTGIARTIYDEHRWDLMPILADSLSEAGCLDEVILGHCRALPHARGCHVLDLILGKE